jgi:hypothetical protein
MPILDYLLLGGFALAILYTIWRLFLGWRNSPRGDIRGNRDQETNPTAAPAARAGSTTTSAPWHRANKLEKQKKASI